MKSIKVVLILLIISCNRSVNRSPQQDLSTSTRDSLISTLVGKWGTDEGKPIWEIKKDSLYYFSEKKSYYYLLHNKDLVVLYKEAPFILTDAHVLNDTLFFKIHDSITVETFRIR